MVKLRTFAAACLLFTTGSPLQAGVVIDPIPPVQPGISVAIDHLLRVPASQAGTPSALIHSLQPVGDGSGRLFVNDTRGLIYRTDTSGAAAQPWFDIRTQGVGFTNAPNSAQTGLMGFAFHPNFGRDPTKPGYATFYTVDTTAASSKAAWGAGSGPVSHHDVVREWTVADPKAGTATITGTREVMRLAQPFFDHGPGTIAFNSAAKPGDADYGKLYIGMGDGGAANDPLNSAQSLTSPFGKILRIDPADPDGAGPLTYSVPSDNPFVGKGEARGEVWAYGLRNPQQFSFDPKTGQMLIAEIGQAQVEEVNVGRAGANYGWPVREGSWARGTDKADFSIYDTPANDGSFVDPIAQYDHEEILGRGGAQLAGIGGAFLYEGSAVPELEGKVILDDLVSGRVFYFTPSDATDGVPAPLTELRFTLDGEATSFLDLASSTGNARGRVDLRMGVDDTGELYFLSKTNGDIWRLASSGVPEPGSWATLTAGFLLAGTAMRRRPQVRGTA